MLVYKGRAAGSLYSHQGGGGNYQCVTEEPETFSFGTGTVDAAYIYGAEYEMWGNVPSASLKTINMMFLVQSAILSPERPSL